MARLTYQEAEQIAGRGRPWTFRLEYTGSNASNQSGVSDKYWYATGRGTSEMVEVGWGRIGSRPQTMLLPFNKLADKVTEKRNKGYNYVNTPYVRMSAANLTKLGGQPPTQAPAVKQVSSMTPKTLKPKSKPVPASKVKPAKRALLCAPWTDIVKLRAVRQGTVSYTHLTLPTN